MRMTTLQEKATEAQIQRGILDYLGYKGIFHWRHNVGGMSGSYKGKSWYVKFGEKGQPDIFCVVDGKIYGCEIKRSTGKQSKEQIEWQKRFEEVGGVYILARSIDDVSKVI